MRDGADLARSYQILLLGMTATRCSIDHIMQQYPILLTQPHILSSKQITLETIKRK